MGEVADMMLDGTLCEGCGVYIGADYGPSYCRDCASERPKNRVESFMDALPPPAVPKVACPVCSKQVKVTGIGDHWRQVHEVKP